MMFIALRELPQGQQAGDRFETTEAMGMVLVSIGAAKKADDPPDPESRRRYRRRDLEAEP